MPKKTGTPAHLMVLLVLLLFPSYSPAESITITGITEPCLNAMLGVTANGRVEKIHKKEGAAVEKGQIVLSLDQEIEKLDVKRRKLIWQNRAEIQSAELQIQTLEPHLKATKELYKTTGSERREDLENQELEFVIAVNERNRLDAAENREEIEYLIAKQRLFERSLRAPFSGRIAELLIDIGENCELDVPLVHLVNTDRGYFVTNVDLGLSQKLSLGQTVELKLKTLPEPISRNAEIVFISPIADPASGLRKIKAQFDNQDGKIIIGVAGDLIINSEN
jgi:RND family efflux transporter MFP subunit